MNFLEASQAAKSGKTIVCILDEDKKRKVELHWDASRCSFVNEDGTIVRKLSLDFVLADWQVKPELITWEEAWTSLQQGKSVSSEDGGIRQLHFNKDQKHLFYYGNNDLYLTVLIPLEWLKMRWIKLS